MNRRRLALIVLVAASTAAALVYLRAQGDLRLALVDRSGKSTVLGIVPASTYAPRVSPDGRRVVYDAGGTIWIAETSALGSRRRLASGAYPLWSSDGSRVLFIVGAGNRQQLFWQAADGSGAPAMLVDDARAPESWSDAAQVVTYITLKGGSDYDVRARSLQDGTTRPVAALSESNQSSSRVSPDGRWIAYESNDSGAWEVYVEP